MNQYKITTRFLNNSIKPFLAIIITIWSLTASGQDISLFNSDGEPIAYIDTRDQDNTIYLWHGKPVAYFSNENIYGFNGKHLGWWDDGVIHDHDGNVIAATKKRINSFTKFEGFKAFKEFKPFKAFKEFVPFKQFVRNNWSANSTKYFLVKGIMNEGEDFDAYEFLFEDDN